MASTFLNLSFELGADGTADDWDFTQLSTAEEIAGYANSPLEKAVEDMESGWDNDEFIFEFEALPPGNFAFYDSTPQDREDFEEEWSANENFLFELSSIDLAQYDVGTPQDFEDFEEEWDSNEDFKFEFVGFGTDLVAATLGGVGDAEDFEQGWSANEDNRVKFVEMSPIQSLQFINASNTVVRITGSWIVDGFQNGDFVSYFGPVINTSSQVISGITATVLNVTSVNNETSQANTTCFAGLEKMPFALTAQTESFEGTWSLMATL